MKSQLVFITRLCLAILLTMFYGVGQLAAGTPTQYKVELENQIRDRVAKIIEKVEAMSIVQVRVNLKTLSSDLPGVGMGGSVIPLESDGKLGSGSVSSVDIRVLTPEGAPPEWVTKEIEQATKFTDVKVRVAYEKIAGEVVIPASENSKFFKKFESDFLETFLKKDFVQMAKGATDVVTSIKTAAWGMIMAIVACFLLIASLMMVMSTRFESSLGRVIDNKLLPALAQMKSGGGGENRARERAVSEESKPIEIQLPSAPGNRELADIPVAIVTNLLVDCYWTLNDGYAHWLWEQATQSQREALLSSNKLDRRYFSYIRQFGAENLKYHNDARYFMLGDEFASINQEDLAAWVSKNPSSFARITPMRWDLLPIGLPERIKFSQASLAAVDDSKPVKVDKKSQPRVLAMKLEVKTLLPEDESYVFENADSIPRETRSSLRTLAWFALAPLDYRQSILVDMDAREICEALVGPEAILSKVREAIPAKKLDNVLHYAKDIAGDRSSDAYDLLVNAGLRAPVPAMPSLKAVS